MRVYILQRTGKRVAATSPETWSLLNSRLSPVRRTARKLPGWAKLTGVVIVAFVFTISINANMAHANSVGPNSASSTSDCVDDNTGTIGTVAWTSPGNAFSVNTTYATVSVDGTTSHYIKCTNFGFSITSGSTINGIVVSVTRKSSSTNNGGSQDAAMRIVKGGTVGTTDKSTTTTYTTSDVSEDHGSSSDLWGNTWTTSDINASNFGAAIAVQKANAAGSAHTVSVDAVRITVYYTLPPTVFDQVSYRVFNNQDASQTATFAKSWTDAADSSSPGTMAMSSDRSYAVAGNTFVASGNWDAVLGKYDAEGNLLWDKTWGGSSFDYGQAVVATSDGGYAMAGLEASYGGGNYDAYLVKFTSTGSVSWNKTWGGSGIDFAYGVIQTADGGYAVCGNTASSGGDAFLLKYDSLGNLTWNKTWGSSGSDSANALIQTSDGGYAITGYTAFGDATNGDLFITKYDSSGTVVWNKTWGSTTAAESGESIVQTSDGGYIVTGSTASFGAGGQDVLVIKYDSSGNVSWAKTWGGSNDDSGTYIVQTSDGGYAIAGGTASYGNGSSDVLLLKLDSSGNLSWNTTFGDTASDTAGGLVQTREGGYTVWSQYNGSDGLISGFTSTGSMTGCSTRCTSPSVTLGNPSGTTSSPSATTGTPSVTSTSPSVTLGSLAMTTTTLVSLAPTGIDVGSCLSLVSSTCTNNTAATIPAGDDQAFRVRVNLGISTTDLSANSGSFKLQYALKSSSCSASTYTDVTDTSTVRYYDNPNAVNGLPLTSNANDPTASGSAVGQSYQGAASSIFSNPSTVAAGNHGMWDFALKTYHTFAGEHYCLRIVKSDGSALDTYTTYPEIIMPSSSYAQSAYRIFQPGSNLYGFAKDWGGTGSEAASTVVQTSDGGYVTCGYSGSFGAGGNDVVLAKFDSTGTLSWSKTWGGSSDEFGNDCVQSPSDSSFCVTGYTISFGAGGYDMFIANFSSTGSLNWSHTWGGASSNDIGASIVATSDGGYAVAGTTGSFGAGAGDIFVAKYTSSGTFSWSRTWGGTASEVGYSITEKASDSSLTIAGETASFGAGSTDAVLINYSSTGTFNWSKTWGGTSGESGQEVVSTSDGGYAMTGYTGDFGAGLDDVFLAKFTSSGSLSWSRTFGGPNEDLGYSLTQTSDGGYAITGLSVSFADAVNGDTFLAKFTSTGSLSWSKDVGTVGVLDGPGTDYGTGVIQTSDGGYAVAAYSDTPGTNAAEALLIKYDSGGNLYNCLASIICRTDGTDYTSTVKSDTVGGGSDYTSTQKTDGTDYTSTRNVDGTGYTSTRKTDGTDYTSTVKTDGTDYTSTTTTVAYYYSASVGSALTATNKPYDPYRVGSQFRLRMLIGVSASGTDIASQSFKLQYALRGSDGACDTSFTGETYADVTTSTPIYFYDGSNSADEDGFVPSANDPTDGSNTVTAQTYQEANNFNNAVSLLYASQDGEWDFSLAVKSGTQPGNVYCLRAVKSSGTALDSYSQIVDISYGPTMPELMRQGAWFNRVGVRQNFFIKGQ